MSLATFTSSVDARGGGPDPLFSESMTKYRSGPRCSVI